MAPKTIHDRTARVQRESKAQNERSPMIGVRVPRSLYRALRAAARDDNRTLADWMRLKLPTLLPALPADTTARTEISQ